MKLWEINAQEGALIGYVPDKNLSMAITLCGINPGSVRDVLRLAKTNVIDMQLGKPSAAIVEKDRQSIPDIVFWSWIAIFSERAVSTAIELGCERGEFWPCGFQTNPEDRFFFHLPTKTFNIVNVEKSNFSHILPLDPPVPTSIKHLVTGCLPDDLPPCFRAEIPQTKQVFGELIVRDDFRRSWERKSLQGAMFRQLSE